MGAGQGWVVLRCLVELVDHDQGHVLPGLGCPFLTPVSLLSSSSRRSPTVTWV